MIGHRSARATLLALVTASILASAGALEAATIPPRSHFGAVFEDPDVILHGVGQKRERSIAEYSAAMPADQQPLIWMHYFKLHPEQTPAHATAFVQRLRTTLRHYPGDKRLQLALSFDDERTSTYSGVRYTGVGEQADNGDYDASVAALGRALLALDIPIYVRIGYEFNGPWNKYEPEQYQRVFRRYTDILREAMRGQVAIMWCSHPLDDVPRLMKYYPGDDYVDWWSIDLFEPKWLDHKHTHNFFEAAAERRKPVFIAESTPATVGVHHPRAWDRWHGRYLALMRRHTNLKAFCYIHRNWHAWWLDDWGDSRIAQVPDLLSRWQQALADPIFRHARIEDSALQMKKSVPRAQLLSPTDHQDQEQLRADSNGVTLTFPAAPSGATWAECSFTLIPLQATEPFQVEILLDDTVVAVLPVRKLDAKRFYDCVLYHPLPSERPIRLTIRPQQPCSIDGPNANANGIAPRLIVAGE